jgi:hypothetical protein
MIGRNQFVGLVGQDGEGNARRIRRLDNQRLWSCDLSRRQAVVIAADELVSAAMARSVWNNDQSAFGPCAN